MKLVVATPSELLDQIGVELGPTEWTPITQEQIQLFAEATGDHQWIHVDVERAEKESPFGGPIAHGYLTLSLVNLFLPQLLQVEQFSMGVNVGLDRVRFPAPVPSGSLIRATGTVTSAEEAKGGVQVGVRIAIEVQGGTKPSCIADTVSRFFP